MLSIVATLIIGLSGVLVFFLDECHTAFGLSFVILICACGITLHSDYSKDDAKKLGRLKFYCIASMVMIGIHLGIAGSRIERYYDNGDRFAVISLVNFLAAELFLTYSIICTMITLKRTKDKLTLTQTNQPLVWLTTTTFGFFRKISVDGLLIKVNLKLNVPRIKHVRLIYHKYLRFKTIFIFW